MLIFIWYRIFSVRFKMWMNSVLFRKKEKKYQQLKKKAVKKIAEWQYIFKVLYKKRLWKILHLIHSIWKMRSAEDMTLKLLYNRYKCLLFLKVGSFDQVEWESICVFNWKKVRGFIFEQSCVSLCNNTQAWLLCFLDEVNLHCLDSFQIFATEWQFWNTNYCVYYSPR